MEDKPDKDNKENKLESDDPEMNTLFSSDNTELTDFTQRVRQAIFGDKPEDSPSDSGRDQPAANNTKETSFKNNVVNLFKKK